MGEQIRQQPPQHERQTEEVADDMPHVDPEVEKAETDKILDEIDGILEENAEEFVATYQQRGGE